MRYLLFFVSLFVIFWISFRIIWFILGWIRRKRAKSPPKSFLCPRCGSSRLDEMSDSDSGYCLQCGNVWGVEGDHEAGKP